MKTHTERAVSFVLTREHHLQEIAEDYVELIADLIRNKGEARTCDLASHLGVSHVTVIRTIRRLQQKGYVHTEPHKPIHLTSVGEKMAALSKARHGILLTFLISIGVPEEVAKIDAEGMEHHVSERTLEALRKLLYCARVDS